MSKKYETAILTTLIKKYERSSLSKDENSSSRRIMFHLNEKTLPEYVNEDSYLYESDINQSIENLKEQQFIEYHKKNGRVKTTILNLDKIEDIYKYLEIESPRQETNQYLQILSNSTHGNNLSSLFAKKMEKIILTHKSHLKYFKNKEELKEILLVLEKLEHQKEEISRRRFSSKYLNDSKRLEVILPKIEKIISELTEYEGEDLISNYNVYKNPTYVYLKGNLVVKINNQIIDLDKLSSELVISSNQINHLNIISLKVDSVITVENLTTFYDYKENNNLIIYLGGFHNEIRRKLLLKIYHFNPNLKFFHSGDIDAGGFYILNHLIEKTNINFIAKNMDITMLEKYKDYTKELTTKDIKRLKDLLQKKNMKKYKSVILYMIENKVKLEQENIEYE